MTGIVNNSVLVNIRHVLPAIQSQLLITSIRLAIIPRVGEDISMVNKYNETMGTHHVIKVEHLFYQHPDDEPHVVNVTIAG